MTSRSQRMRGIDSPAHHRLLCISRSLRMREIVTSTCTSHSVFTYPFPFRKEIRKIPEARQGRIRSMENNDEAKISLPEGFVYKNISNEGNIRIVEFYVKGVNEAERWVEEFEDLTKTTFTVRTSSSGGAKKVLICHHNTRGKVTSGELKRKTKHTNCPAKLTLKVKKTFPGESAFSCIVKLDLNHNHNVDCADALSFRKPKPDVIQKFKELFSAGHSPSSALHTYKLELMIKNPDNFHLNIADRSIYPDSRWVSYLFEKTFDAEYGKDDSAKANLQLEDMSRRLEEEGGAMNILHHGNQYAIAIITPLMKRMHSSTVSGEVVFIDSTGGVDKANTRVFLIMTYSVAGGLPLGVILTSSETEDLLRKAFNSFKGILPEGAFGGRGKDVGPAVIITDDSSTEQKALAAVWPNAANLLCTFHVLQALWRWLWDSKHGIKHEHRPHLFNLVKALVRCEEEDKIEELFHKLVHDRIAIMYPRFVEHIRDIYQRNRAKWAVCYRKNLTIRGINTNNFVEAGMRIVKDLILGRTKAFSLTQLADIIIKRFNAYYEDRLISAAHNRVNNLRKLSFTQTNGIKATDIKKVSDVTYEVASQTEEDMTYIVDTEAATCSCPVGYNGKACKHQFAVMYYYNEMLETVYDPRNLEQRSHLFWLGTGRHPPCDFLKPLSKITEQCDPSPAQQLEPVTVSSNPWGPREVTVSSVVEHNEVDCDSTQHGQSSTAQASNDPTAFLYDIIDKYKQMPDIYEAALQAAQAKYYKMKTDAAIVSALFTFGKEFGVCKPQKTVGLSMSLSRRGPQIRVQPTAISRRMSACGRGARRQFAGRPSNNPPQKRQKTAPHNLSHCVSNNTCLGKTHSRK